MSQPPEPSAAVEEDVRCAACGYNLRGLPTGGQCPECGAHVFSSIASHRVAREAAARPLGFARRRSIWMLALGCLLIVAGSSTSIALFYASLAFGGAGAADLMTRGFAFSGPCIMTTVGCLMLFIPRPAGSTPSRAGGVLRRTALIGGALNIANAAALYGVLYVISRYNLGRWIGPGFLQHQATAATVLTAVVTAPTLLRLAQLARRLPSRRLPPLLVASAAMGVVLPLFALIQNVIVGGTFSFDIPISISPWAAWTLLVRAGCWLTGSSFDDSPIALIFTYSFGPVAGGAWTLAVVGLASLLAWCLTILCGLRFARAALGARSG